MEKLTLGAITICKMETQEYDSTYDANLQEHMDGNITHVVWAEVYENGKEVASSTENMYVLKDGSTMYTSRYIAVKAQEAQCLEVVLDSIEEL